LGGFQHSKRSIEPFLALVKELSQPKSANSKPGALSLDVDFESHLRYVNIPVPDLPQQDKVSGMITVRSEVKEILDWLRDKKGVKGIYELHVRDSLYVPHSEEVIGKCLVGFDIEILDWKRVDMSIEPLLLQSEPGKCSCPNLKELTLYASGWASLQYWASKQVQETLRQFPNVCESFHCLIPMLTGNFS